MKNFAAIALAVVFVMALAVPAFAQMTHSVTYEMDGEIDFQKQAGHACNTGAVHKQTIAGSGDMTKVQSIAMVPGKLTMEDANDYVAGETSLTVTSVIELCAPPKYTYGDATVSPMAMYGDADQPYTYYGADEAAPYWGSGQYTDDAQYDNWTALTGQIWAAQVQADPGFSGSLHQDFEAAYGPYGSDPAYVDDEWNLLDSQWGWDGNDAVVGSEYVGNYFDIDQTARTSMGTVQRYIDVSSPWSHGYLREDMSVVGKSLIDESFGMNNLPAGAETETDWWVLF